MAEVADGTAAVVNSSQISTTGNYFWYLPPENEPHSKPAMPGGLAESIPSDKRSSFLQPLVHLQNSLLQINQIWLFLPDSEDHTISCALCRQLLAC